MGGQIALRSEVLAGGDDADSEISLPDAINNRARRGGRVSRDKPSAKRKSCRLAILPRIILRHRMEEAGSSRVHQFRGMQEVAAGQYVRFTPVGASLKYQLRRTFRV